MSLPIRRVNFPGSKTRYVWIVNGVREVAECSLPKRSQKAPSWDVSPIIVFSDEEKNKHITKTILDHYTYYWPSPTSPSTLTHALALGLGPVFNHSLHTQNIGWTRDIPTTTITYVALRDIRAGEELCISYGSSSRLWFEDTEAREWESMMENWPWREGEREDEVHDRGETLGELELSGLSGVVVDLEE